MAVWVNKGFMKLPTQTDEDEAETLFQQWCPYNAWRLRPHQRLQASLSTGGLGLSSATARRLSAFVGSMVSTLPAVLVDLSGPNGDRIRYAFPDMSMVRSLCAAIRLSRDDMRIGSRSLAAVLPQTLIGCTDGPLQLQAPSLALLTAHDNCVTPRRAQGSVGELVQRQRFGALRSSFESLPATSAPP